MIRVLVNGAFGKMGTVTQAAIKAAPDLELVATLGRQDDLASAIKAHAPNVAVDFTLPDCVFQNTQTLIDAGVRPVIGTSGLNSEAIDSLTKQCADKKLGGIIAPNFSVGAILMMRYAKDAIRYFPHAEIIEMHHEQKVDAPSGTAAKTADVMSKARDTHQARIAATGQARGHVEAGIPIHSVRLPGLFAHQTVMFGGPGETLTIRHDSTDRGAMMPGVCLACREVMTLDHLVYGLEHVIT